jgi:hypothetical protein
MGSKNNQAAALTESEQSNTGEAVEMGKTPEKERETSPVKMDINRYLGLGKVAISKSLANLLRVMFKGQMATEAEWESKTQEALNRGAK